MSEPFVGEIQIFAFNFAPRGWAFCQGQLLAISQNTALFSLLGTQFGGDGKSTFALPNLQGSIPNHFGQGPGLSLYDIGQTGGEASVILLASQLPAHTHTVNASSTAGHINTPSGATVLGAVGGGLSKTKGYTASAASNVNMGTSPLNNAGGSQPHNNMAPYVTLNYCIALQGIFPPRS